MSEIVIENNLYKLIISSDCCAKSLIFKPLNEECLYTDKKIPLFSITEKRPFNNEIKLAHPNKRTTFNANRVRREDDKLIIGFELILFEAVVKIKETPEYISFELEDFIVQPEHFYFLCMDKPPVEEFRLLQIPIKKRTCFGEWLNVCSDESIAVGLIATSPYERIDSVKEEEYYILTADAVRDIKLKNCETALIVSAKDKFLDCVEAIENDYDLPKGVKSRRSKDINSSIYWADNVTPDNLDTHIEYIKKCGFTKFLFYYSAIFAGDKSYAGIGDYVFEDYFPNGADDLKKMLDKVRAEGITPGLHILHTHIGLKSKYLTPVADHRLNLTRHFTLSKDLKKEDNVIYVEENPQGTVMHENCRVLKFGGELIKYEGYTTEYPYHFFGCERGFNNTYIKDFEMGTIGGILNLREYCAISANIDQHSGLQDEIADKIAKAYNAGFEFIYFDGSEGTNPPYEFHVSNAQYRVYKKFEKAPLFCEGAAKSHFGWHMLSGGNAFDIFPPEVFKKKIAQFPADEAPKMAMDFTRINFGWWNCVLETQPDMYEYGTSRAVAWNCPVTVMANFEIFEKNPRSKDLFEVLNRWEDVRKKNLLTDEQKNELKNTDKEHILLLNENNEYELVEYKQIKNTDKNILAFIFERNDKNYVVCWHTTGKGNLYLKLSNDEFEYAESLGGQSIQIETDGEYSVIPVEGRRYLSTTVSKEILIKVFENAELK